MATRSLASLTISFGLVAIPVKLYSATQSGAALRFNLLHKKDGSRVRQQYVCVKEDSVVGRDELVRGYQVSKDRYVTFTAEEIKTLEEAGTHTIDLVEFVPLESVDPVYYEHTYYLAPDKRGTKPYVLLAAALRDTGRCGVGRWASHGRDHVVILRPLGNALALQQLHFDADVRSVRELGVTDTDVRDSERKLARQLIEQLAREKFDPKAYTDESRSRIRAAIRRKAGGEKVVVTEPRPAAGNVINLMDALKASLARKGDGRAESSHSERHPPRRAARRSGAARRAAH